MNRRPEKGSPSETLIPGKTGRQKFIHSSTKLLDTSLKQSRSVIIYCPLCAPFGVLTAAFGVPFTLPPRPGLLTVPFALALLTGLFAVTGFCAFLKLVDRLAVALSLVLTFSVADKRLFLALAFPAVDKLLVAFVDFALGFAFDTLAAVLVLNLLMVFPPAFVVFVVFVAFAVDVVPAFFLVLTVTPFFLDMVTRAFVTAFLMPVLTDLAVNNFRFLFTRDVDSSSTLSLLRFVPAELDLDPFFFWAFEFFLSSDFASFERCSFGRGPRTPRQVGAPQRHSCTFFRENGLEQGQNRWKSAPLREDTHSKL